jgi:TolA-binding protein
MFKKTMSLLILASLAFIPTLFATEFFTDHFCTWSVNEQANTSDQASASAEKNPYTRIAELEAKIEELNARIAELEQQLQNSPSQKKESFYDTIEDGRSIRISIPPIVEGETSTYKEKSPVDK